MPRSRAEAILGAMRAVALEHGEAGVTELDRRTIDAADWDFWAASVVPLDELRAEYGVPPADPDLLI